MYPCFKQLPRQGGRRLSATKRHSDARLKDCYALRALARGESVGKRCQLGLYAAALILVNGVRYRYASCFRANCQSNKRGGRTAKLAGFLPRCGAYFTPRGMFTTSCRKYSDT